MLSAESEDNDLAGDEGRFKGGVARKGLSDRRITEGDLGLFNSGSIGSEARSLVGGWAERGRRVAAIPEPLLPSKGERGCFSRGDVGACSDIFSLNRASFASIVSEFLELAEEPLLRRRGDCVGEFTLSEEELAMAAEPVLRRDGDSDPSGFSCSAFDFINSIDADPLLLVCNGGAGVASDRSSPFATAAASCVEPRLLISAELFAN